MDTVGMFQKCIKLFMSTSSINRNHERGCLSDERSNLPENTTLATMDVTSLYPNIPHDDGIAACRKIWEQRTDQEPPTECLVGENQ
jgi:hypothetical protein